MPCLGPKRSKLGRRQHVALRKLRRQCSPVAALDIVILIDSRGGDLCLGTFRELGLAEDIELVQPALRMVLRADVHAPPISPRSPYRGRAFLNLGRVRGRQA